MVISSCWLCESLTSAALTPSVEHRESFAATPSTDHPGPPHTSRFAYTERGQETKRVRTKGDEERGHSGDAERRHREETQRRYGDRAKNGRGETSNARQNDSIASTYKMIYQVSLFVFVTPHVPLHPRRRDTEGTRGASTARQDKNPIASLYETKSV